MAKTMHVYCADHGFTKPYATLNSILKAALNGDTIAFKVGGLLHVYKRAKVEEVGLTGAKSSITVVDEMGGASWI